MRKGPRQLAGTILVHLGVFFHTDWAVTVVKVGNAPFDVGLWRNLGRGDGSLSLDLVDCACGWVQNWQLVQVGTILLEYVELAAGTRCMLEVSHSLNKLIYLT